MHAAGSEEASVHTDHDEYESYESMKQLVLRLAKESWQCVNGREWRSDSEGEVEREREAASSVTIASQEVEMKEPGGRNILEGQHFEGEVAVTGAGAAGEFRRGGCRDDRPDAGAEGASPSLTGRRRLSEGATHDVETPAARWSSRLAAFEEERWARLIRSWHSVVLAFGEACCQGRAGADARVVASGRVVGGWQASVAWRGTSVQGQVHPTRSLAEESAYDNDTAMQLYEEEWVRALKGELRRE
jgi:hypothetical protein